MEFSAETAFVTDTPGPGTPKPEQQTTDKSGPTSSSSSSSKDKDTVKPPETNQSVEQNSLNEPKTDSPTPQSTQQDEVTQVVSQLSTWGGSLWGGFKKQADSALDAVKKDFARTVSEAQDEIKMLQDQTASFQVKAPDLSGLGAAVSRSDTKSSSSATDKGKGKDPSENGPAPSTAESESAPSANQLGGFFKTLQSTLAAEASQLNANLSTQFHSLQSSLSESIANNPSLAQLNTRNISTLSSTIQQNLEQAGTKINLKQAEKLAEEYLKRGESLLGEAGTFLKDAVKVVPPDQQSSVVWDGSDIGMYAEQLGGVSAATAAGGAGSSRSPSSDLARSQLRLNALLRRLKGDTELLSLDPLSETSEMSSSRQEMYKTLQGQHLALDEPNFQKLVWVEMGPGGSDEKAAVTDGADVEVLKATKEALVPSQVTEREFWSRYFFHKQVIQDEEKKRQALLQGKRSCNEPCEHSIDLFSSSSVFLNSSSTAKRR